MKKLSLLLVCFALGATTMFAQYVNSSATGSVTVNVARNASVVVHAYNVSTPGVGYASAGINSALLTSTVWLVQNQEKTIDVGFKVTGEPGANITITTGLVNSTPGNSSTSGVTQLRYTDNTYTTSIAGSTSTGQASTFAGSPGHLEPAAELYAMIKSTVTGLIASSTNTLTYSCTLSAYNM